MSHCSPSEESIPLYPTCSPRPVPTSLSGAIVGPLTSSPVCPPPLQTCPFEAGSSNWWFQRFLFCHAAWKTTHMPSQQMKLWGLRPPASIPEPRQQQGGGKMLNSCCWQRSTTVARPTDATACAKAALANFSSWSNLWDKGLCCVWVAGTEGYRLLFNSLLVNYFGWLAESLFLIPLLWLILINSPDLLKCNGGWTYVAVKYKAENFHMSMVYLK